MQACSVRPVHTKDQRRQTLAQSLPCLDNIGDQQCLVHGLRKLAFVIVTGNRLDACKVWMVACVNLELRQIALVNQPARRGGDNQVVKPLAQALRPRRRRQTDKRRIRCRCHPFFIGSEPAMRLVNYHHIRVGIHRAPVERLHAANLYRLRPVGHQMLRLNNSDLVNPLGKECFHGLINQRQCRHAKRNLFTLRPCSCHDCRRQYRLTRAGRGHHHWPLASASEARS